MTRLYEPSLSGSTRSFPARSPFGHLIDGEWPMRGRDRELERLRSLLRGDSSGVILAGPAGVGKTRLALELLRTAEREGLAAVRITGGRATAKVPFGALATLLPASDHGRATEVDHRTDLMRRSAAAIVERGNGRRPVLMVDDVHLLDELSAALVYQLVTRHDAFALATLRTGARAPESVVALWADGVVERVDLAGLDAAAIGEVVSGVLGGPVDAAVLAELVFRCQGNVLFLRELVLGALEDGGLSDSDGIWHLARPLHPSERLSELVEARWGQLAPPERQLLDLVSFAGVIGPAELDALSRTEAAESLERKGILETSRNGARLEIRLAHPLYGDVARSRIPASRVPSMARSLAEVVEGKGARRREDTLRVATWRLDGGGASPEPMLAAARTARWRYDFPLAARLSEAAVRAGAGFDAALLAAQVAGLEGRGAQAEAQLTVLAAKATDDTERALVAIARLDNQVYFLGQIPEALVIADEADAAVTDLTWRDEITAKRGGLLLAMHGPRAAAEAVAPLLVQADGRGLVWACVIASYGFGRMGRIEEALAVAERGHAANLELAMPMEWYPWYHLFHRGEALAHAGRFIEADTLATRRYEQGLAERSAEAQAFFAWQLCKRVGERGHVRAAIHYGHEAVALFRQLDRPQYVGFCLGYVALAHALGGEPEQARTALADLDALGLPETHFMGVDLLQARAWTALVSGNARDARRLLTAAAATGEEIGDIVGAASALHGLARLGAAAEVSDRLAGLGAVIEGELITARAAHARHLADGDAARLEHTSSDFAAMGADLLAAEAMADASQAWRHTGDIRRACEAERHARTLLARCDGAVTPSVQRIGLRVHLTPAETDTALLAASGRSNKEIADQFRLSVRTVESYLQHVYAKLGIRSRAELPGALETSDGAIG